MRKINGKDKCIWLHNNLTFLPGKRYHKQSQRQMLYTNVFLGIVLLFQRIGDTVSFLAPPMKELQLKCTANISKSQTLFVGDMEVMRDCFIHTFVFLPTFLTIGTGRCSE